MIIKKFFKFLNSFKLLKTATAYVFFSGLNGLVPFLLLPIITNYLNPEEYGIANLFQTTAQFNANQQNAVAMNNAGRKDATSQFNKKLADNRDQTYKRNSIVIDQANAVYRRQINTANTALKNAETEYNTSQRFNVQQNAKNNLLQDFKDQEYFARTLARDDKEFQNSLALSNFAFDQNIKASADIAKGRIVGGVLTSAANAVFEDIFSPTKSKPKEV